MIALHHHVASSGTAARAESKGNMPDFTHAFFEIGLPPSQ